MIVVNKYDRTIGPGTGQVSTQSAHFSVSVLGFNNNYSVWLCLHDQQLVMLSSESQPIHMQGVYQLHFSSALYKHNVVCT